MRYLSLALCVVLGSPALGADPKKEQARLENCGVVMQEILDVPDIPQELLEKAECVVVIPSMTKVAVGVGGSYGRGAMFNRSWARSRDVRARRRQHLACSSVGNQPMSSCSS
jgi:lipid-binding SYLF domain-containing protein